jgi:hypothetical protein
MFNFKELTDDKLCKVYEVFKECSKISFFKPDERYQKLKSICSFFENENFLIEWLDENNTESDINSIVVFKHVYVISEMGERFYQNSLELSK